MSTPTIVSNAPSVQGDLALLGLAAQCTAALLPSQGEVIARLTPEARREIVAGHLDLLAARNVLTASETARLQGHLKGESMAAQFASGDVAKGSPPPALTVADILDISLAVEPSVEFESFLDVLWDAAVTVVGALIGEAIGGPPGAGIAALAAHEWAQAHPPSTWRLP
jgi:hypothetical protein